MTSGPKCLWLIKVRVSGKTVRIFENALEPFCTALSTMLVDPDKKDETWDLKGYTDVVPDKELIQKALVKAAKYATVVPIPKPNYIQIKPKNWLSENLANFPPLKIGYYLICSSHSVQKNTASGIILQLNAGTAFGSGKHPSTAGCLIALSVLARKKYFKRPLDIGCGSGILALAIAKTWHRRVIACDIDKEAIRVTSANAKLNNVKKLISVCSGNLFKAHLVLKHRPYDLVVANILTRPLKAMSKDLTKYLKPGGVVILSGFLQRDSRSIIQKKIIHGLRLIQTININGWVTIIMRR